MQTGCLIAGGGGGHFVFPTSVSSVSFEGCDLGGIPESPRLTRKVLGVLGNGHPVNLAHCSLLCVHSFFSLFTRKKKLKKKKVDSAEFSSWTWLGWLGLQVPKLPLAVVRVSGI